MDCYGISLDGKSIVKAPTFVRIDGEVVELPTVEQYALCGYFPYAKNAPEEREGYSATIDHYEAVDGRIYAVYTYSPLPPVVTRYSKLKIYGAITALGKWADVEEWLKAKTIGGVNGWMAFQLAQEVSDDHPLFAPLAAEAKTLLELSDEAFAKLLANCILED